MKKIFAILLISLMLFGCTQDGTSNKEAALKDGSYETTTQGHNGEMKVTTVIKDGKIAEINADHEETQGLGDVQINSVIDQVIKNQNLTVDEMAGATVSTNALLEGVKNAIVDAGGSPVNFGYKEVEEKEKDKSEDSSKAATWDATPEDGLIKGDYYKVEERFRQGHLGTLEAIVDNDKIIHVYFNEYTRPNYYNRYYQNVSKRYSEYNVSMKDKKGAAWIEGVLLAEKQILESQDLSKPVDTVSGASNSIEQSFIPLAEKLSKEIVKSADFKGPKYYQQVKTHEDGLIGVLKIVVENNKIIDLHYDEIFPMDSSKILEDSNKKYAGLSKYDSVEYDEPSRIGFNVQMDSLKEKVLSTQDLFDLSGLPAIEDQGDYKTAGFTKRNTAWDHYLDQAKTLHEEMKKDGVLN